MSETIESSGQRDRSPAYPIIPLGAALDRLTEFELHFKRSPARAEKIGDAWGIKAKAHADRIAAALRYFGLLDYQGATAPRMVVVSEEGRKFLRAQQEETKQEVVRAAALRPKQIAKFWGVWGADRPADAACLDELVLSNGFSESGAREFLKVYDSTIAFAKLAGTDKNNATDVGEVHAHQGEAEETATPKPASSWIQKAKENSLSQGKVVLMEGERVAFTEEGRPGQYLKLIASGDVDDTMLEALEDFVKRQRKRIRTGIAKAPDGD